MDDRTHSKPTSIKVDTGTGMFWFIGWLFTVAFTQLGVWEAVLGLVIWPYYLGMALRL